ncbi:MAG: hypothetical protein V2A73_08655 [Pseudomonadota bacterium]
MSLWSEISRRLVEMNARPVLAEVEILAIVERQRQIELRLSALRAQTLRRRQMRTNDGGRQNAKHSQSLSTPGWRC